MIRIYAAFFEIMDKEPSALEVWLVGIIIALVAFFATRWRWWAGAPFILLALVFAYSRVGELNDPEFGPAIRDEAGLGYVIQSYLAVACALLGGPLGRLMRRRAV